MKKYRLILVICLGGALYAGMAGAQDQKDDHGTEEIVIRKKGDFPQKLDIQLNGNQVTINGKKPEDIKGNIEVIRRKSSGDVADDDSSPSTHSYSFRGMPGNMGAFPDSDAEDGSNNKALLGVLTLASDSLDGARVAEVERGTPADSAGLQKNDLIVKVGTTSIHSAEDLSEAIGRHEPGDMVTVSYDRNGETREAKVNLGRNDNGGRHPALGMPFDRFHFRGPFGRTGPEDFMKQFRQNHPFLNPDGQEHPKLGITVEDRDDQTGVTVKQVKPGSPAETSGFKAGDVLIRIGGKEVNSVEDVVDALRGQEIDKSFDAAVDRNGKEKKLTVKIPKPHQDADL